MEVPNLAAAMAKAAMASIAVVTIPCTCSTATNVTVSEAKVSEVVVPGALILGATANAPGANISAAVVPGAKFQRPKVQAPTIPLPPVPSPTVSVPTVPVPTVPAATVPAPTVAAPTVPVSTVPAPIVTASTGSGAKVQRPKAPAPPVPGAKLQTPIVQVAMTVSEATIPAPKIPEVAIQQDVVSNYSNIVGFKDGIWYKVRNVGDNNVVQVDPNSKKLICMPEDCTKNDLQSFRAIIQPNGKYSIMAKFQKSNTAFQVWDYLLHRKLLVQMKQSGTERFTQNWESQHVRGYNSLYLIQSGPAPSSQKCLKNTGSGKQIELIDKSEEVEGDHYMHWVLELQDMPS